MPTSPKAILESIPDSVKRSHHGRSPDEGFDCIGLMIWFLRESGASIDDLDIPYTESAAENLNRSGKIGELLTTRFRDVTGRVAASLDKDGDIWLVYAGNGLVHACIQAGGLVYHMSDRLHKRKARMMRAQLAQAFRL